MSTHNIKFCFNTCYAEDMAHDVLIQKDDDYDDDGTSLPKQEKEKIFCITTQRGIHDYTFLYITYMYTRWETT